jgi:hypothetical protein
MLLIWKSRLKVNSRKGRTTPPQAGPSRTGMNSGATTSRNALIGSDNRATIASARSYARARRSGWSWTCAITGKSTRFTIRPKATAGMTINV